MILIGGLLGAGAIGIVGSGSCDEETAFGEAVSDCTQERTVAWIAAGVIAFQAAVAALLFFAARAVISLLIEIAEKDEHGVSS
jgi:hypothetical protein